MAYSQPDRYISLLTDFGFKRVFGTEPNKRLLIDFLNTLLPSYHQIRDVTFKNSENLGNTLLDRKAIFDIYCEASNGELFMVEIQKVKQNLFKDQQSYQNSLKYYRDLNNVVDTSRQEGVMQGREDQTKTLITRQLTRRFRQDLSSEIKSRLSTLPLSVLEDLSEALLDFSAPSDLETWLARA